MVYNYSYTINAKNDLNNILDYLSNKLLNLKAAKDFYLELEKQITLICSFPESAPIVKNRFIDIKEVRKINVKSYLVYYYVDDTKQIINVLAILHSLENYNNL